MDVLIKNRVRWSHEYVLSGLNKEQVSYDQLNVTQWVAGFGQTMREESDPNLRQHMLDYLIAWVMQMTFPGLWPRPATPFCCVGWNREKLKIFLTFLQQQANAQKHVPNSQTASSTMTNSFKRCTKVTKSVPCTYFNQGSCMQTKSHETKGVLYKHICASCFANNGRTFPHTEVDCKNKNRQTSKND